MLTLQVLPDEMTICKVKDLAQIDLTKELVFVGKTDEELSLVCKTADAPAETTERDDGWRAIRFAGKLDLTLTGIMSKLAWSLAAYSIEIAPIATFNTDYVLVRKEKLDLAIRSLKDEEYKIEKL